MARVKETPLMAAKDIVRNLTVEAKYLFKKCSSQKCACGNVNENCRDRYLRWQEALKKAEAKIKTWEE